MIDPGAYRFVTQPEGFVSVDPLPDPDELAAFYEQLYYQSPQSATFQTNYSDCEIAQRYMRGRLLLHAIAAATKAPVASKRVLEVGCGEGFLLKTARDAGCRVRGIDFSSFGLERWHPDLLPHTESGNAFQILDRIIEEKLSFDICVLQNVLEHVINPRALMDQLRCLLSPGGVIAVTVPNDFSGVQIRAEELGLINRRFWLAPPQHLHYFNTNTLAPFVRAMGFEPLDAFADFPIELYLYHPASNYIADSTAGKGAHRARIELELLLAESGFERLHQLYRSMTECGLGRNITMIARPASARP